MLGTSQKCHDRTGLKAVLNRHTCSGKKSEQIMNHLLTALSSLPMMTSRNGSNVFSIKGGIGSEAERITLRSGLIQV